MNIDKILKDIEEQEDQDPTFPCWEIKVLPSSLSFILDNDELCSFPFSNSIEITLDLLIDLMQLMKSNQFDKIRGILNA